MNVLWYDLGVKPSARLHRPAWVEWNNVEPKLLEQYRRTMLVVEYIGDSLL